MALTTNNCEMIKAIAENDMNRAKKAAIASCNEDKTQKNKWFVERYKKVLSNSATTILNSIPSKLTFKLAGELPNEFDIDRYYLSDGEKEVYEHIYRMKRTGQQLDSIHIRYSNSTLLYGPSGTGKTMFGKYIAYKLNLPFFYINFAQMIDSYMGETSKNISAAFEFVRQTPCVFMIDEIDCVASKRSASGGKGPDGELERTTIGIIQELDKLPNTVVLIGATNRKDLLDEAILRRFSVHHEMLPFDGDESKRMVKKYISEQRLIDAGIKFSDDEITEIIKKEKTQALIINTIVTKIGQQIYDNLSDEIEEDNVEVVGAYKIKFTYEVTVATDDMEEALEKAKREFSMCHNQATAELERL